MTAATRAGAAALVGIGLSLGAEAAWASPCGGGSGGSSGGGSSSGGSSSGGDDSSSSSSSSSSSCVDDHDVVGYRRCRGYGTWSAVMRIPRLIFQVGTVTRTTPTLVGGRSGELEHEGEQFAYRTVTPPVGAGMDHELGLSVRAGFGLRGGLFVAGETEVGGLVSPANAHAEMTTSGLRGTPSIEQRHGTVLTAVGVVGVARPTARGSFGVELAGGVRHAMYAFDSSYGACEQVSTISGTAPVAEARARAERWLSPWVTVGASVGASVIDRGAWMGSLYLGVQTRAFGGGR